MEIKRKEDSKCVQQQLIRQQIFILDVLWIMNFPMGMKWQSCHGIMHCLPAYGYIKAHYAIIGMAYVVGDYPLYYDGINEKGLGMAGLNFVGNAVYQEVGEGRENIAQFEFIPWILAQCASVEEAREKLDKMNLVGTQFGEQLPAAQLHWIIADEKECIVVECMVDGLHVYDNPVGVLTNNPPFPQQMFLLNQYMHLSPKQPVNTFCEQLPLEQYSRGMGALGLPGDLSSTSRFACVAFTRLHAMSGESEAESVSQFFPHFRFG